VAFSSGTEVAMPPANRYRSGRRPAGAHGEGPRCAALETGKLARREPGRARAGERCGVFDRDLLAQRTGLRACRDRTIIGLAIFLIVFCELVPRRVALRPTLSSTYIYKVLVFVMTPIIWLTNKCVRIAAVVRCEARDGKRPGDVSRGTALGAEAGLMIPTRHRQMLLSILDLEHVIVNDIMIPRQETPRSMPMTTGKTSSTSYGRHLTRACRCLKAISITRSASCT
jgi:hypothetical protein